MGHIWPKGRSLETIGVNISDHLILIYLLWCVGKITFFSLGKYKILHINILHSLCACIFAFTPNTMTRGVFVMQSLTEL